jgi:hypothetical protein
MEQSPSSEANGFSASHEIPLILWNPKVLYRIHKCPPPDLILSRTNPNYALHATSWRPILVLPSHLHLCLPSGLYPLGFPTKTLYTHLLSHIDVTCSVHPIGLDLIVRIIRGDEYRSLNYSLRRHLHFPVTSSLLGPNFLHSNGDKSSLCLKPFWIRNVQTNVWRPGFCSRFHSYTLLLALPVSWGYRTQWEYYARLPS